jgi:pimeloyl-ACP methyl ester carboxylesterase
MDERSSMFVDKLAMDRLINDKLIKVRHSPDKSCFFNDDISFEGIDEYKLLKSDIDLINNENGVSCFQIPSFYQRQIYKENNHISIYAHVVPDAQSNILFVHGLFDDNMGNYTFIIKQLNELNFNVFFLVLPYHFNRRPAESCFGGEYFFSADVYRTRNAFKQAVLDIEAAVQFIGFHNSMPVNLLGFSMGGCISFKYYLLKKNRIKTFLINPVTDLKNLVWDTHLLVTVGRDLRDSNLNQAEISEIFLEIDPCEKIGQDHKFDNLAMVYSTYDQVIENNKYNYFINRMGIKKNTIEYPAGHLNVFRVPRLAMDMHRFLNDDY